MRKYILYLLAILLAACSKSVPYSDETIKNDLRVPAYPLLMLHPHLRLWSTTDQLTEKNMIFTNGKNLPFVGLSALPVGYYMARAYMEDGRVQVCKIMK